MVPQAELNLEFIKVVYIFEWCGVRVAILLFDCFCFAQVHDNISLSFGSDRVAMAISALLSTEQAAAARIRVDRMIAHQCCEIQ